MSFTSHLIMLVLSPVMFVQAIWVRKKTPVLAEAGGKRQGCNGKGNPITIWVVGDSAAAGVGVTHQQDALSGQLVSELANGYSINWQCHAKSGARLADLNLRLASMEATSLDAAVVSIGVNDVVKLTSKTRWRTQLEELYRLCTTRHNVKQVIICAIPTMQDFPALPSPLSRLLGARAKQLNAISHQLAGELGMTFLPQSVSIAPEFMAQDGFHPGLQGYKQWAKTVAQSIIQTLN